MEEIAEKAGVGKGTIYEYFKIKFYLFHEMLIMQIEKYFCELEKASRITLLPLKKCIA